MKFIWSLKYMYLLPYKLRYDGRNDFTSDDGRNNLTHDYITNDFTLLVCKSVTKGRSVFCKSVTTYEGEICSL